MLQKCANPSCSTPFRSLREGKLFLAETLPGDDTTTAAPLQVRVRRREHFWLCQQCSSQFTLRLDDHGAMLTVPISGRLAPRMLSSAARQGL